MRWTAGLAVVAALIAGCGGGGGGGPPPADDTVYTVPYDPDAAPTNPSTPTGSAQPPLELRILFHWQGHETQPMQLVARNEAEYEAITDRCNFQRGDWGDPPPDWVPPVDFDEEIVVAVFLGTVNMGVWLDMETVTRAGDGARISWVQYVQGPGYGYRDLDWLPCVLAAIPRVEGPVTFSSRTEIVPYTGP